MNNIAKRLEKMKSRIVIANSIILIIILNVTVLNNLIKRKRLSDWIKKQCFHYVFLQETLQNQRYKKLKVKIMGKDMPYKWQPKEIQTDKISDKQTIRSSNIR